MRQTTKTREEILLGLEPYFQRLAYKRNKDALEWRKKASQDITRSVHFNFGLYGDEEISIIPSLTVWHKDIQKLKNAPVGFTLTHLAHKNYRYVLPVTIETIIKELTYDISKFGLPIFENLENLDWVLNSLSSNNVVDWCVASRSDRARLIPLILYIKGDYRKAVRELKRLKKELGNKDQIIPDINHFEKWFLKLISIWN